MSKGKNDSEQLYFIGFIPPSPIADDGFRLKQYFHEQYGSKAALNSPPHITLHMPFRWKEGKEALLMEKLQRFARLCEPVKICIDNFGSFPPRVIFLNVVKSELLDHFQKTLKRFCKKELNLFNADYQEEPFHPHITLAFRDLKKPAYKKAWEEFSTKEYKAEFIADRLSLLKHDGKKWNVRKDLTIESSYSTRETGSLAATEG